MSRESIVVVLIGLAALVGCNKSADSGTSSDHAASSDKGTTTEAVGESPHPSAGGDFETAAAKEMFKSRCATCHGAEGKGNGPGAITLNPKPRNYTDKAWQSAVTDEQIRKTIVYGGAAVGKSPMMPASPDLDAKPVVVDGLLRIIRDFGK